MKKVPKPAEPAAPPEVVAVAAPAAAPGGPPKPEDLREFTIDSFEAGALRAAHENRTRAAQEQRAAEEQFADLAEQVIDRLNAAHKTDFKIADFRAVNFKKRTMSVVIKKKEA